MEPRTLADAELRALVTLLADRDRAIVRRCHERLVAEGERALPFLAEVADCRVLRTPKADRASQAGRAPAVGAAARRKRSAQDGATTATDPRLRHRARDVIAWIERTAAERALIAFAARQGGDRDGDLDLEDGAFLLARTAYPALADADYRRRLDRTAAQLATEVRGERDPRRVAEALAAVVIRELGLRGNARDYENPDNSFVNRVLDRGLGIPISLCAVYLFVARRLDLPLEGVAMPGHFLLACGRGGDLFQDPFGGGRLLDRADCLAILERLGIGASPAHLAVVPDRHILARMVANLVHVYASRDDLRNHGRYERIFRAVRGAA